MNIFLKYLFITLPSLFMMYTSQAQTSIPIKGDPGYVEAITKRSQKIVDKLNVDDQKSNAVLHLIAMQYSDLNQIHTAKDLQEKAIDAQFAKEEVNKKTEIIDKKTSKAVDKLHQKYLKNLNKYLNEDQIETVKNEMTYNVLPITYKGYLEMLPALTAVQKKQLLDYLTEAREHAMDAGSSKEKHAWFGKYKGKINNYLSKEGVETKLAREEWERKLKEK